MFLTMLRRPAAPLRQLSVLCVVLLLAVSCATSAATNPDDTPNGPPSADTTRPFPIDAGSRAGAPRNYKGLPLQLVERTAPVITAVDGVIGVVCIGMSNGNQECNRLIAATSSGGPWSADVAANVRLVNCAVGGHAIERWNASAYDDVLWNDCISRKLAARGVRLDQVRVLVHKAANQFGTGPQGAPLPLYPSASSNYEQFTANLDAFAARVPAFFPSVQAVYTSSRSYGGFSTRADRGEPQSYEEGHALNSWLAQHAVVQGVWYGWWGYLWAPECTSGVQNGSAVCVDRADYQADAVHPTPAGEIKLARIQHDRLLRESWYRR